MPLVPSRLPNGSTILTKRVKSGEQRLVVEFVLVGQHVRVGPGGRDEVTVADELPDPRP